MSSLSGGSSTAIPGATVLGQNVSVGPSGALGWIPHIGRGRFRHHENLGLRVGKDLLHSLIFFIIGLIIYFAFPKRMGVVRETIRTRFWLSLVRRLRLSDRRLRGARPSHDHLHRDLRRGSRGPDLRTRDRRNRGCGPEPPRGSDRPSIRDDARGVDPIAPDRPRDPLGRSDHLPAPECPPTAASSTASARRSS